LGNTESTERAPESARRSEEPEHHRGVALLLSAAAVLAALIGARASVLSANAATSWQEGTRAQVKESAGYVESIRYIYGVEVPRAVLVTETRFRIEELSDIPKADKFSVATKRSITIEKKTQEGVLKQVAPGSILASKPEYRTEAGFDPVQMLIDDREQVPALLEIDPHELKAEGDETGAQAIRLIACSIFVAFAFLCGSLARGFPNRRRQWLASGVVFLGAGLVSAIIVQVA
jgi:hypothetical protein